MRNILPYTKAVAKPRKGIPDTLVTVGDHIRKTRIERDLTQKDVALVLGVDEDSIVSWEMRGTEPMVQHYPKIIRFLGYYPFMEDTETLGGTLLMSRRMHGLSANELGKWLGVHGTTILSYEKNKTVPSQRTLALYYEFDNEQTKPLT